MQPPSKSKQLTYRTQLLGGSLECVVGPPLMLAPTTFIHLWWFLNTYFMFQGLVSPRYHAGTLSLSLTSHLFFSLLVLFYSFSAFLSLVSLLRCNFSKPGVLEDGYDELLTDPEHRSLCKKCGMVRPRRTHHCRICNKCIRRFDHHCVWINNCVGQDNNWLFLCLVFYATAQSVSMLCALVYYLCCPSFQNSSKFPPSFLVTHQYTIVCIFTVLNVPFTFAMLILFASQKLHIQSDTTRYQSEVDPTFQDFILNLGSHKLSNTEAFSRTCGTRSRLLWLLSPLRRHTPSRQIIFTYPEDHQPGVL